MTLEPSPQIFHRVDVRRVRRQERQLDLAVGGIDVIANQAGAMCLQAIPDNQQSPLQMGSQRFEEVHDLCTSDGPVVKTKHALSLRHARNNRQLFPVEVKLDNGGLTHGSPGLHPRGAFGQSGLVDEDYYPAFLLGFFLSLGSVCRLKRRTTSSSRSIARRSGLWLENPNPPRMRQTCTALYRCANSRSMRWRTRLMVQSGVPKPCAGAPSTSNWRNRSNCSGDSCAGRPPTLISRSASMPPSSRMPTQVYTVWRATPTALATSAGFLPAFSIRPALTRRLTASSIRFLMRAPHHLTDDRITHENKNGCHDVM